MTSTASETRPRRSRWFAGFLSLVAPGFGQIYVGASTRGLAFFFAALLWPTALIYLADRFRSALLCWVLVVGGLALTIISAVDAVRLARRAGWHQSVVSRWYFALLVALLWKFIATPFWESNVKREIAEAYRVGAAMAPTMLAGDWVLSGRKRDPIRRGDIVVFQQGVAETAAWYNLRAVALSNDTVAMRNGRLFVNGQAMSNDNTIPIREDWTDSASFAWQLKHLLPGFDTTGYTASMANWGPFIVPPKNMFLLGDNRQGARDSRYIGMVDTGWVWGEPHLVYFSVDYETHRVRWERIGLEVR